MFVLPKMLSMPGLYIINDVSFTLSSTTGRDVAIFSVTDSYSRKKRQFRFDAESIAPTVEKAKTAVDYFIKTGKILSESKMSHYRTPYGYSQSLTVASFDKIRNQPCLVRYTYAGKNIGMLFYPHQLSF